MNERTGTYIDLAKEYLRRDWAIIPIPFKSKSPTIKGWQKLTIAETELPNYFNGAPQNIGIILGAKSGGLVDIDLDSPEAVKIADYFLPETKASFGRATKPRSHRLYISDFPRTEKFEYSETIVEIRSTGGQTVFPGSTHISGELIEWQSDGEPLKIDSKILRRKVGMLAAACLISKVWGNHLRNSLNLAVSGAMLRNGFDLTETKNFIRAVGTAANDEEISERLAGIETTAQKLQRGENVYGIPKLKELTDKKTVETFCKWLEIVSYQTENKEGQTPKTIKTTFNFTPLDDLLSEPAEEHDYIWENTLIFGGLSICSAKPKVGKSTLARNLAVAITQGADFLGRKTVKSKVIYLCLEEKRSEIAKHFRSMGASGSDILIHTGKTPNDALLELELAIAKIEPALVIIDPLARMLRVNDFNDYGTMSRGLEPFIDLARKTSTHILALHHEGKGDREGGDAILGSTAIFGAVDCQIQLRKKNNGRTVSTTQRYGVDLPETVIELNKETGVITDKGDLENYILQEKKSEIFNALNDTEKVSEAEIKERVGGNSKGIISKALRLLLEEQLLEREGNGRKGNVYLYFKKLEKADNEANFSEYEKQMHQGDNARAAYSSFNSRFVGFSNSENPENPENLKSSEKNFYHCPHCQSHIPLAEDVCPDCKKRAIDF